MLSRLTQLRSEQRKVAVALEVQHAQDVALLVLLSTGLTLGPGGKSSTIDLQCFYYYYYFCFSYANSPITFSTYYIALTLLKITIKKIYKQPKKQTHYEKNLQKLTCLNALP